MYPCQEYSPSEYIESKQALADKIAAIDAIIEAMENTQLDTAMGAGGGIAMYELDDGHVRIKTTYRGVAEIQTAIDLLEKRKIKFQNRLQGRATVLMDKSVLRGNSRWLY